MHKAGIVDVLDIVDIATVADIAMDITDIADIVMDIIDIADIVVDIANIADIVDRMLQILWRCIQGVMGVSCDKKSKSKLLEFIIKPLSRY